MFADMLAALSRPYRQARSGAALWQRSLAFGAFVWLFLALFRPFGLAALGARVWPVAAGYGAVCALVMIVMNALVPMLLPRFFEEERWTVGREIAWSLLNVTLIGAGNVLYSIAMGFVRFSWTSVLWFEFYTLLIGLFPVTVVVLSNEARLARRYREGSDRVNATLKDVPSSPAVQEHIAVPMVPTRPESPRITLPSETGREDLVLFPDELLFLRSSANYVEVHHLREDRPVRTLMRASLKRAEGSLVDFPQFLRCHKSHIVNVDQVQRVSGNAQGYKLHLRDEADPVPVSRQLNDRLEELLAKAR